LNSVFSREDTKINGKAQGKISTSLITGESDQSHNELPLHQLGWLWSKLQQQKASSTGGMWRNWNSCPGSVEI
jgi:hypothetical protein